MAGAGCVNLGINYELHSDVVRPVGDIQKSTIRRTEPDLRTRVGKGRKNGNGGNVNRVGCAGI